MLTSRIVFAIIVVFLAFSHSATSAERSSYVFLGNAHYPPFIYQENGATVGLGVDLTNAVIERAKIQAQFVATEWTKAQDQVRAGDGDALVLINKSPQREILYDFSEPLLQSEFVIFRKTIRVDINNVNTLANKKVGLEKGGHTKSLLDRHPQIHQQVVVDINAGFDLLERDEIDALITERWAGEFALAKRGTTSVVALRQPVESSTSFIAVRKGNRELLDKINAGLRLIDQDGSRTAIQDRWSKHEIVHVTRESFSYYQIAVFLAVVTMVLLCLLVVYIRKLAKYRAQLEARVHARTLELATARAEAESANAVKTRFMANVSQQMRAPLQMIIGYGELGRVMVDEAPPDVMLVYFDTIHAAGLRLHNMVESLLAIADKAWNEHIGGTHESMQEIELAPFAMAIGSVTEFMAKKSGQRMVLDLQATNSFWGDPVLLRQVFEHMMGNAVRYSQAGATTTLLITDAVLSTKRSSETVPAISFQLTDQGCGIPEREITAVFEPFYESTRTHNGGGGSGLGLPLSRAIVLRHQGTIALRNNSDGGVTCQVILPCVSVYEEITGEPEQSITQG
jgi:signal transduction histidine kinase